MSRYLVTGANGFVGRTLCRCIAEHGGVVRALLRHPVAGPWSDQAICELGRDPLPDSAFEDIDGVFHLAGIAHVADLASISDKLYRLVNVEATLELALKAQAAGVRTVVYFSSVRAAGAPGRDCVDEGWNAPPSDPYGQSKRDAEAAIWSVAASGGMHAVILRPTLVYGVGVKGNLHKMIHAIAARRFPPLPELDNRRSMVSVGDLATAAWLAMTRTEAQGRTYIVADGVDYSTRRMYLAILAGLGRRPPHWVLPRWVLMAAARVGDRLESTLQWSMPLSSPIFSRLADSACYRSDRLRKDLNWSPSESFYDILPSILSSQGSTFT